MDYSVVNTFSTHDCHEHTLMSLRAKSLLKRYACVREAEILLLNSSIHMPIRRENYIEFRREYMHSILFKRNG